MECTKAAGAQQGAAQFLLEHRGRVLRCAPAEGASELAWFTLKAVTRGGLGLDEAEGLARIHVARARCACAYAPDVEARVAELEAKWLYEQAAAPEGSAMQAAPQKPAPGAGAGTTRKKSVGAAGGRSNGQRAANLAAQDL